MAHLTSSFRLAVHLFSNRSLDDVKMQHGQKCGTQAKIGVQMVLTHFDVFSGHDL